MTTFDDREKGYESKFAHDEEIEFKAVGRRNRMVGLWAAELMGLEGEHRDDYARAIIKADIEQHGEEEVIVRKLFEDLTAAKVAVTEGEVRRKMDELLAIAREEAKAQG